MMHLRGKFASDDLNCGVVTEAGLRLMPLNGWKTLSGMDEAHRPAPLDYRIH